MPLLESSDDLIDKIDILNCILIIQVPQSRQAKGRAPTSHAPSRAHSRAHSRVSQITGHSRNRKFSSAQGQDLTRIKQHVYDRMDHIKPQKVRIDGFRIGDESSYGPFAWQITTPIK